MKVLLVLLAALVPFLAQRVVYVDQSNTNPSPDGNITNPHTNLTKAFDFLSGADGTVIFMGNSYVISTKHQFTAINQSYMSISIKALNDGFSLIFAPNGYLNCLRYGQLVTTITLKNVNLTFQNMNIVAQSSYPLFQGSCNFTYQNVNVPQINNSFIYLGYLGNLVFQNVNMNNIKVENGTHLIDHDGGENLAADYFVMENVNFKNTYVNSLGLQYTSIKSFIQYKKITIKNSVFQGIGFNIKGEQIGGNLKSNITVINVTMSDSTTFFFIESFGFVLFQDTLFTNASNKAIHYFLTDENLSPDESIFDNCTFLDNNSPLEGGGFSIQGSKETSYQFSLNLLIKNSKFINNSAEISGGGIAFNLLRKANLTIFDCEFTNNKALEGGGAIQIDQGEADMTIKIYNNQFRDNSAFSGGVFSFEWMNGAQITLENNEYTNNTANFEGGIGFISESMIDLSDSNSQGILNIAKFEGGSWSLKGFSTVTFTNITFADTDAFLKGGCIFNYEAILALNNVTLRNCSLTAASSQGGAIFISEDGSLEVTDSIFENNVAEHGAAVYFQSLNVASQALRNIELKFNLLFSQLLISVQTQIECVFTGLILENFKVTDLTSPFLSHSAGFLKINGLYMDNITCKENGKPIGFCIFELNVRDGQGSDFELHNLTLHNVNSIAPMISSQGSKISWSLIDIQNIATTSSISVASITDSSVKFTKIDLLNISSTLISTSGSQLDITEASFNNEILINSVSTATQYITTSESEVSIKNSDFRFNSKLNQNSGGAISIINPLNIDLYNLTFNENKAKHGGAIYIEGSDINGTIRNCTFYKNEAKLNRSETDPGFGGAMFIQNPLLAFSFSRLLQESTRKLLIQDCFFINNIAYTGGAIYAKELNFTSKNNTFIENQAISAGAIAAEIDDQEFIIDILESTFLYNDVDLYGASYLQLRKDVIRVDSATIIIHGHQVYDTGAPMKLRVRTFSFSPNVITEVERNITDLLARKEINLTYDSFSDFSHELILDNMTSGGYFSQLIEITICDAENKSLTELTKEDGNISISITGATYPVNATKYELSLAGITQKGLVNGSVVFLDELNFFAYPETLLNLEITSLLTHRRLGNLNYEISSTLKIQLLNCRVGELFHQETLICDPCKQDFYSLTDPFNTYLCKKCPIHEATCPGGSLLLPKPGYWRIDEFSDNLIACPYDKACLGGYANNKTNLTGFCDEGYTGNACATCETGWGKFGSSEECLNCSSNSSYYIKLFFLLALQLTLIILNILSNLDLVLKKTAQDYDREQVIIYQSTVIKVLVDWAQVLGIVGSINIEWPTGLANFGSVLSNSVPSSKDSFSLDCFISLSTGFNTHIFFYKILALNLQPFAYFVLGTAFWAIWTKIRGQKLRNNRQFKDNVLVTNIIIAYILQPELVKSTLQLFKCVNLGSVDFPQNFLQRDLEIKCGEISHLEWALGLGVPSIVIWLIVPIVLFTKICYQPEKFSNQEVLNKYHFLFKRYKTNKIYWDLIIIVRKSALIFFLVFLSDLYSQIFFSFAVFVFCLQIQHHFKPYVKDTLNQLEVFGLLSNCCLLFGGLFFIQNSAFGVLHGLLMTAIIAINLVFIYKIFKAYWVIISKQVKNFFRTLRDKIFKRGKSASKHLVDQDKQPDETPQFYLSSERKFRNANNEEEFKEDDRSLKKDSDHDNYSSRSESEEDQDESLLHVQINKIYMEEDEDDQNVNENE